MGDTTIRLRDGVRRAYSAAARQPEDDHPFPVGRSFAESLGYPRELLDEMPSVSVEAFAGVSNVSVSADIPGGAVVLDLGCGAGMDSLIAARRAGPSGRVSGVDFSSAMLDRARRAAEEAGVKNVVFCRGDAERLPMEDGGVDVALVNGIFNLNPARGEIFRELGRVVRRGGEVHAAELILRRSRRPLHKLLREWLGVRESEADWFA
jgi:arsenite methyltransferase